MSSSGVASQVGQSAIDSSSANSKRRLLAVSIAVILVASGTVLVWNQYFRYWTIEDVGATVTGDVLTPDFKHSLANRTIIVKGTVTNITSWPWLVPTTLGTLYLVELDDFDLLHLVYWDQVPFNVGERVKVDVSFEWSCYNEEVHVYSPQLDFPVISSVLGIATATFQVSLVCDIYWTASYEDDNLTVSFDWVGDGFPLDESNCSLRAGQHSFSQEYIDVLRPWCYGTEMDMIDPISSERGETGLISYSDADGDSNLSSGDSITVSGLSQPESDSGIKCYMILLGWDYDALVDDEPVGLYLPLTNRGLLLPDSSYGNFVRLNDHRIEAGFRMDVEYSLNNTFWSDTGIRMWWDFNCSDHNLPDPLYVPSLADGVDFSVDSIWRSDAFNMGEISWILEVADANGDGMLNVGDSMSIFTDQEESIPSIEYLQLALMYEPNGSELDRVTLIVME